MSEQQQVVVIGAGPAGLLTALGLARNGIEVTVLERSPGLQDAPRAIVYHWATLDGLAELDLLDDAVAAGFLKQDYAYRVASTGEVISYGLAALDGKVARPYNLHLGQGALAQVVLAHLQEHPHARVLWDHEVTGVADRGDHVVVTTTRGDRTDSLRADWVVAADGAGSPTRRALGVEFEGMTWPERFVATNVRFPDDRPGWAQSTFYVDPVYGAIVAKIDESGEHGLWRYTYMEDGSLPAETAAERLPTFLAEVFGEETAAATELVAMSPYRMHQRSATTYRVGRVLLAGDAAHATNPTGGLGLTMGIFDAYALHQALGVVSRGGDERVLDRYADLRRRAFVEHASPRAAANKQLLFHSADPVKLDRDLAVFRRMATDTEFAAGRLFFTKTLETPSLLGA